MHFPQSSFLLAAVAAPLAGAFPSAIFEAAANDPSLLAKAEELARSLNKRQAGADAATAIFEPVPIFNEQAQFVNVSKGSGHEYVPPSKDDLRGPCPGLNAFANHNFLPHNGYATVAQYVEATTKVVGMGANLALFLSALGGAIDGDVLSWSMGGTPSLAQGGPTGILGHGLVGSHNKYVSVIRSECETNTDSVPTSLQEGDGSPTRPDLYQAGNDYMTVVEQFQEMIDQSPGGEVTLDSLAAFRSYRFDKQIATNPSFFYGPFSGVLVTPAAYTFIYRFMANHSEEFPVGRLDYATVQSWFGIEGESGNYKAVQGGERIPENWVCNRRNAKWL
jgi:hypothetical protein